MHQLKQQSGGEGKLEFDGFLKPQPKPQLGKSPMQQSSCLDEAFDQELENEEEDEPSGSFFEEETLQRRLQVLDSQPSAIKELEVSNSQSDLLGCL